VPQVSQEPYRGNATWPGITGFAECVFTSSWGRTPGVASLTVSPRAEPAAVGDLVLTDGRGGQLVIADCKVARPTGQVSGGQVPTVTVTIEDARWRWRYLKSVSGAYNVLQPRTNTTPLVFTPTNPQGVPWQPPRQAPKGEEAILPWTRKTARELAKILCELLVDRSRGAGYDVSDLDDAATPSVDWDHVNPAEALEQLIEPLGCVLCYHPTTGDIKIARRGAGYELPEGSFMQGSQTVEVLVRPARLRLWGARTRFQQRLRLRAVGLDFDGTWKPIEKLSYAPSHLWRVGGPPAWGIDRGRVRPGSPPLGLELPGGRFLSDAKALAAAWIYRAFQVELTDVTGKGPLKVPPDPSWPFGQVEVKQHEQVRLLPCSNVAGVDDLNRLGLAGGKVYGVHFPPDAFGYNGSLVATAEWTDEDTEVHVPWSIVDPEKGVIAFSHYIYIHGPKPVGIAGFPQGDLTAALPPKIVLSTAFELANETNQFVRYYRDLDIPDGDPDMSFEWVREEVQFTATALYGAKNKFQRMQTNESDVTPRADFLLDGESERFIPRDAGDRHYPGILPLFNSGGVPQVTWSVGGGSNQNPSTHVSRNTEHNPYIPPYRVRRQNEFADFDNLVRQREEIGRQRQNLAGRNGVGRRVGGG
jgi:hypothetical protein